ncbi:MAG: LysR substrate-binding domain-containing protein [Hydrogenophaga sp.]|uniref:LysR substrate-binding domain-containing protein n=1 Tax=Hydrogenophaga sp. TaxID=1904254 RepID=UPI000CA7807B|nr:LysR substrate-binding domain-containing protein [Hydrogenophaga sp.]MBU4180190.1 LysR family transcriptional regulator [Gammaproteobacteria bacterium]PKO75017.1 MAG: LysR family transcriptional regulator [Betaproteobacteria bacterium HGW-Betaproteobacteria-15]MBU4283358.1 LysR family transcriptional regulator [Gammaproteobacteria bacterium]MBU4322732.1 LysR family transcriptional regulator [Gammaproteobacteria bacterium]MBU4507453.1 LysR family transcriptional regulator [Gammaproteobacteri
MQDLNDMLLFAEVVERGGFAAAGRALGLPKSRLSRRVAGLEAQLGVRLLQRTTRKLSLTEVGEAYLRHCQALRESAQAAADTVAQVQTEPRGTLRVACPVTLAQTVLAELMPDFLAQHPLVRVEMMVSNRVVDLVEEGVDVALRVRTTLDDSGSLVVKRLGDDAPVLVASPALLARQGTPTTLDGLSRLDSMAMSTTDGRASIPLTDPDGKETVLQHTPRYVADDLLTLHVAALAGTGMCWLPSYMCEDDLRQGRLVRLLPDWQTPRGVVHAVFPSRRGLTPAVRCFLDFLGEHVPTHSSLRGSEAAAAVV